MLSTPHLLVGATVGSLTPNPFAAFIAGFLSHFIMDMIPHYDWKPIGWKLKMLTFIDFFFGAALLFYLTKNSVHPFVIWAGAMGGVFPDILAAPYYLLNMRVNFLEPLRRIHGKAQKIKVSTFAGVLTQVITLIITTWFLSR